MRKSLLIISLLTVFWVSGNAQVKDVRLGIKMGPSFDWASSGSTVVQNNGLHFGFNAGLVIDRYFTHNVAISSGLNFCHMRMRYQFNDSRMVDGFLQEVQLPVERRINVEALEVPIKAKLGFEVLTSVRAYVEAGAALGFSLKDRVKDSYEFYSYSYKDQIYVDRSEQYRLLQASLLFGLGAEYEVNRNLSLFAQVSFSHGLVNAFTKELEKKTGSILNTNYVGIEVGVLY